VFGLPFTIFRPHNVYGERQNLSDPYRNVIGIFFNRCRNGQPLTVFGDGQQTRAFTHVDDVAPLIARAPLVVAAQNETFNVGADEPVRVVDLAREIANALGMPARIEHLPARPEVLHAFADHRKARQAFNPPAPIALPDGLRRMAAWLQTLTPAAPKRFAGIEVPNELPPSWR